MKNRNLCVSLGMLAFSGVLLAQTMTIKVADSRMLPMLSFVLCAVSGAVLLIQSLTGRANDETGGLLFARKEWLAIVALLACWALMPVLGFFASIFLMLMAISLIMAEGWTARTVGRQAALNLAFTACLYVVFVVLLQMVTPSGLII